MDCRVLCAAAAAAGAGEWWKTRGGVGQIGGAFSHESEHDLALMVSDFLENGGSGGAESWCSSDSDSGFSDLAHQVDKLSFYKPSGVQFESDLLSVVHSLMLAINSTDLHFVKSSPCNASCIRFSLVKLLRLSGYDAAVCLSRWQGSGKVPGGDHEYIDVVNYNDSGNSERLIIDIDFRSHFEIARAVDSYNRILKALPVAYVGSLARLKQYLQVMVDAARSSLKQNSMPLPPWRSLPYLQSKWLSPCKRMFSPDGKGFNGNDPSDHKLCCGHLKRLQSLIHSETEECFLKPLNGDNNRRPKLERRRHSLFRTH
ncbi:hypothetical protein HS088_TW09G00724 [Tripterygium wilfordii]|uniref:Plant-specific domain TIGR01615 family protein n=1 Tax=Tripterygium wilfordii TaxID=458696 RepID=A0A7J7D8L3_TRIWF|nr:uncharacterized protein LOC120005767 [Tripterygium wilfordii]KAF5742673.1 hypothetical protein HS088_TW09G00724 [Tripterygium wilfordii]